MEDITSTYIILDVICTFLINYKNIRLPHRKLKFKQIKFKILGLIQISLHYTYMQPNIYLASNIC
jgi:hypothetical protein